MIKPKRATASKRAHRPKVAAKAQQAAQAIVRSPVRSAGARRIESSRKPPFNEPLLEPHLENSTKPLENHGKQPVPNNSHEGTFLSVATASVSACQAKLLEMAQANMQLAFEFAQRLATIRSPLEFPVVISEFTSKRVTMFRKHSTEIAELSIKR